MNLENTQKYSYLETFKQAGLTENQALVYEVLLKLGKVPASKIHNNTPLKKGLLYKVLEELAKLGLVVIHEKPGKVTAFEPEHPDNLKKLLEVKKQEVQNSLGALDNVWLNLTQDFNLIASRPTVQFFEGIEGAVKALKDSLKAKTELCSYINNEAIYKYFPSINEDFVSKRHTLKIKHRILSPNNEVEISILIKEKVSAFTETRVMNIPRNFPAIVRIYEDSVCFQSLNPNKLISIIIRDNTISNTMQTLFNAHWENATPLAALPLPQGESSQ